MLLKSMDKCRKVAKQLHEVFFEGHLSGGGHIQFEGGSSAFKLHHQEAEGVIANLKIANEELDMHATLLIAQVLEAQGGQ